MTVRVKPIVMAIVGLMLLAGMVTADVNQITSLTVSHQPGFTVLTITGDDPFQVKHQSVEAANGKPYRIVVDCLPGRFGLPANSFDELPSQVLTGIRCSQFAVDPQEIVRIVMDVSDDCSYRIEPDNNQIRVFLADAESKPFGSWTTGRKISVPAPPAGTPVPSIAASKPAVSQPKPKPTVQTRATELAEENKTRNGIPIPLQEKLRRQNQTDDNTSSMVASQDDDEDHSRPTTARRVPTVSAKVNGARPKPKPQIVKLPAPDKVDAYGPFPAIPPVVVASIGELQQEKNQPTIVKAIGEYDEPADATVKTETPRPVARPKIVQKDMPKTTSVKPTALPTADFETPATIPTTAASETDVVLAGLLGRGAVILPDNHLLVRRVAGTGLSQVPSNGSLPFDLAQAKSITLPPLPVTTTEDIEYAESGSGVPTVSLKPSNTNPDLAATMKDRGKFFAAVEQSSDVAIPGRSPSMTGNDIHKEATAKKPTADAEHKDASTTVDKDANDKKKATSVSRYRRSTAKSIRMKQTQVVKFPERMVIKYSAAGTRDPFKTLLDARKTQRGSVATNREVPNIESLSLVGILESGLGGSAALLEDVEGIGYILRQGDRIKNGYVAQIHEDAVYFQINEYGWTRTAVKELEKNDSQ